MSLGQQVPALGASVLHKDAGALRQRTIDIWRASEREEMRGRLRTVIVPGLEQLVDPGADPADLIALADVQARRLRTTLEHADDATEADTVDATIFRAREEEREIVRGHLHDTALQILEFIAGDGFGTGLSAPKIAQLAGGAARDLQRWIDTVDESAGAPLQLVLELEQVAAEARALDSRVELVVGDLAAAPTPEQVAAITGAVREAVTNARKHAQASNVVVRVETGENGQTAVTVTDDGIGIDPEVAAKSDGLGVKGSIVGRMKRAGGSASLEEAPGGGTLVKLVTSFKQGG